ncbi:MAG: hypothetical protein KGH65_03610 [Candidatus Micrarchaeota archaeon]|nr:hypothetical protein [Candidatus Micrarchaeota archaeon]
MAWSLIAQSSVAGTNSLNTAVPIPSGISSGQLCVFLISVANASYTRSYPDASFVERGYALYNTTTSYAVVLVDHIVTSTDVANAGTGTWTFSQGTSGYEGVRCAVFSGNAASGFFDTYATATQSSWGTLSLTTANANELLIYGIIAANTGALGAQPTGFTDLGSFKWNGGTSTDSSYEVQASAGATGNVKQVSSPTSYNGTILAAYIPASGGTVYNENLGIAGSAAFTDVAAVSFNDAIGMAGAAGFSDTQSATINATAVFAGLSAIGFSSGAQTYNENLGVAGSAALVLPANISANTLLSMAGNANITTAAHAVFNEVAAIAGSAGLQVSSTAIMAVSMALAGAAALGMSSAGAFVASLCWYYYIMLESRTMVIPAESRTYYVGSENRTEAIPC